MLANAHFEEDIREIEDNTPNLTFRSEQVDAILAQVKKSIVPDTQKTALVKKYEFKNVTNRTVNKLKKEYKTNLMRAYNNKLYTEYAADE